ncbi:MAG: transposase [Actinomycetota bacterium]|nr:transposase [Actinomycetota bacterium]
MDSTDVEVYGSRKQGVAYNYAGQRAGRPHLATWAEAGVSLAAELLAGNDDVRPRAAAMLRRALAAIPAPVQTALAETGRVPRARVDAGYFTGDLANAAVEEGCDFAIAAKRNTAMWRAYASISDDAWVDAQGMPGAQVAAVNYAPGGWPEDTYTIVRRVRVDAEAISADPRSRRRRTIAPGQLALALEGTATHAYAVSFIVTNIPANDHPEQGVKSETIL